MARKRRRRQNVDQALAALTSRPDWRWRTLPVWVALTGGFVLGWFVGVAWAGDISYYIWVFVLGGFWFGIARIIGRLLIDPLIARRRLRAREVAAQASGRRRDRKGRAGSEGAGTTAPRG